MPGIQREHAFVVAPGRPRITERTGLEAGQGEVRPDIGRIHAHQAVELLGGVDRKAAALERRSEDTQRRHRARIDARRALRGQQRPLHVAFFHRDEREIVVRGEIARIELDRVLVEHESVREVVPVVRGDGGAEEPLGFGPFSRGQRSWSPADIAREGGLRRHDGGGLHRGRDRRRGRGRRDRERLRGRGGPVGRRAQDGHGLLGLGSAAEPLHRIAPAHRVDALPEGAATRLGPVRGDQILSGEILDDVLRVVVDRIQRGGGGRGGRGGDDGNGRSLLWRDLIAGRTERRGIFDADDFGHRRRNGRFGRRDRRAGRSRRDGRRHRWGVHGVGSGAFDGFDRCGSRLDDGLGGSGLGSGLSGLGSDVGGDGRRSGRDVRGDLHRTRNIG